MASREEALRVLAEAAGPEELARQDSLAVLREAAVAPLRAPSVAPRLALAAAAPEATRAMPPEARQPFIGPLHIRERGLTQVPVNILKGAFSIGPGLSAVAGAALRPALEYPPWRVGRAALEAFAPQPPRAAAARRTLTEALGAYTEPARMGLEQARFFAGEARDPYGLLTKYPLEVGLLGAPFLRGGARLAARPAAAVAERLPGRLVPPARTLAAATAAVAERGPWRPLAEATDQALARTVPGWAESRFQMRQGSYARQVIERADEEFFTERNASNRQFVRTFGDLKPTEHAMLDQAFLGFLDRGELPPRLQRAFDDFKALADQDQADWFRLAKLKPETARRRAYQALVISGLPGRIQPPHPGVPGLGIERQVALQVTRRKGGPEAVAAERALDRKVDQLAEAKARRSESEPVYRPWIRVLKPSDFLPGFGRQRYRPKTLRLATGTTYATGQYVTDPIKLAQRMANERLKYRQAESIVNGVMNDPRIPKRPIKSDLELQPGERSWSPQGFLQLYKGEVDFGQKFGELMERQGLSMWDAEGALADAIRSSIDEGAFRTTVLQVRRAQAYAFPEAVVNQLTAGMPKTSGVVRLFIDQPNNWFRTLTLPLRPAWWENNMVGVATFSLLHGDAPRHWVQALNQRYAAKMPQTLRDLGTTAAEAEGIRLGGAVGEAGLTGTLARLIAYLETKAPFYQIGRLSDYGRAANQAFDTWGQRASYIKEAERYAVRQRLKDAHGKLVKGYEALDALDQAGPDAVNAAVRELRRFHYTMARLTPFERSVIRRGWLFYGFFKHQLRLLFQLPLDYPGRSAILEAASLIGQEAMEQDNPRLPPYLRDKGLVDLRAVIRARGPDGLAHPYRMWLNTAGINPLILGFTPAGGGEVPQPTLGGVAGAAAAQVSSPVLGAMVRGISPGREIRTGLPIRAPGVVEEGGRFYRAGPGGLPVQVPPPEETLGSVLGGVPPTRLVRRLIEPTEGLSLRSRFTRTRTTELLRFFTPASITLLRDDLPAETPLSAQATRRILRKLAGERLQRTKGGKQ